MLGAACEDMMIDSAAAPVQAGVVELTGQSPQGAAVKALDSGTLILAGRSTSMSSFSPMSIAFSRSSILTIDSMCSAVSSWVQMFCTRASLKKYHGCACNGSATTYNVRQNHLAISHGQGTSQNYATQTAKHCLFVVSTC